MGASNGFSTTFMSAGSDAVGLSTASGVTTGMQMFTQSNANCSGSTVQKHTGSTSIACTGNGTVGSFSKSAILADAGRRLSFYFFIGNSHPTTTTDLLQIQTSAGTLLSAVSIDMAGKLNWFESGQGSVLTLNTWHRLAISYTLTTKNFNEFRGYLNGDPDGSASNNRLSSAGTDTLRFGFSTVQSDPNRIFYYDDIYVDAGNDLQDPGDIRVTAKLPSTDTTNQFDSVLGASAATRYAKVNERPMSEVDGFYQVADATQFSRPNADVSNTGWATPSTANLSETTPDDNTSFTFNQGGTQTLIVGISAVTAPPTGGSVTISFRAKSSGSGAAERMTMRLFQGTTLIAQTAAQNLSRTAFTTFNYTLTAGEVASITDYSALLFHFVPSQAASETVFLTWAQASVSGTGKLEAYGIEDATSGEVNISSQNIVAYSAWAWAKIGSGSSSGSSIIMNGSERPISLTTTPAMYSAIEDSNTYPASSLGVGLRASSNSAITYLYETGMLVAFSPIISVSISPDSLDYGTVPPGSSRDTTVSGINTTITATNTGSMQQRLNIRGTNSASWALSGAPGTDQYAHSYCWQGSGTPDPCDAAPSWLALALSYKLLAADVPVDGSVRFDLKITTPTASNATNQQPVNVIIQAIAN